MTRLLEPNRDPDNWFKSEEHAPSVDTWTGLNDMKMMLGKGNAVIAMLVQVLSLGHQVIRHGLAQVGAPTGHTLPNDLGFVPNTWEIEKANFRTVCSLLFARKLRLTFFQKSLAALFKVFCLAGVIQCLTLILVRLFWLGGFPAVYNSGFGVAIRQCWAGGKLMRPFHGSFFKLL